MAEYRYLKRTCSCGKSLNAHRSAVVSYNRSQPMGLCPNCGKLNPLNAPKKRKPKVTKKADDGIVKYDNPA